MALLLDLLVTGQTRLNDDTYAKNIYADKFIRTGSSDLYVLLGGGGHKLLSDFSMAHSHPYLPLAGGWMDTGAQIYFKGLNQSTSVCGSIGYRAYSGNGNNTMHNVTSPNNTGALYITTNGYDSANDYGGLAIDNDGVTAFGAGDSGSVFRVINEDNVADGAQFYVTKAAGAVVKRSLTASNFVSNAATGTQPYACTSTTCNTNLNADLLDGKHATNFLAWSSMQSIGSSSPFQDAVNFFNILSNLNNGGKLVYNHAGEEYTELFTRRSDSTAHGTILKWGYTDKYIRIIRMVSGTAQSTDWEKISAGYADSAGNADTVDSQHFSYSNDSNSPTYLWATNSNGYSFLAARGSISVNYANSAGTATTLYTNNTSQDASLCYDGSPGLHFYRFNGTGNDIGGGDGFILQWSWNPGNVGGQIYLDDNPSKIAAIRGYDSSSKTFTSWSKFIHSSNYTDYVNTTNFPGLNKVGTVTSVTVTGSNGLSGSGTITSSGTITLSNAGVRSTIINGDYLRVNTNGTNDDLTIPFSLKTNKMISSKTLDSIEKANDFRDMTYNSLLCAYLGNSVFEGITDGILLSASVPGEWCHQIHFDDNQVKMHHRSRYSNSAGWSPWYLILDSLNSSVSGGGSTGGSSMSVKIANTTTTLTIPASLPASDVYDWAKQSTKPSYSFSEITPGVATIGDGANRVMFRTHASYKSGMYYSTPGNESMVFGNINSVTSWIFATTDPSANTDWRNLTPSLQIKNGRVTINKLISDGTNAAYNLDVNGTANATTLYENGVRVSVSGHTHTKANITDFPSSLPANGGDADTVDGYHASSFSLTSHTHDYIPRHGMMNSAYAYIPTYNGETGWHRIATIKGSTGYGSYILYLCGNWSWSSNTNAIIHIDTMHTTAQLTQVSGIVGYVNRIRLVNVSDNEYYVDVHINYTGANTPGTVYCYFLGNGTITPRTSAEKITDSVTSSAELGLVDGGRAHSASSVVVNDSNSNSNYRMLWHSGNTLYSTDGIYCNPSSDVLNAKAFTLNGASSSGTNYITGTAGRIYFGGNFHIDSLGSNATYINHYTSNNVYLVSGSSQGNVGIGTSSPSYKLDVNGTLNATRIIVNSATYGSDSLTVGGCIRITGGSGGGHAAGLRRVYFGDGNHCCLGEGGSGEDTDWMYIRGTQKILLECNKGSTTIDINGYPNSPGFIKTGSDNNYVLLGGGGHKAISDFSMSHNHPYLPLAGGTMNQGSHVVFPGTSTDTNYGGSIEFREVNYVTTSQTDWSYAPGITFHWGGLTVGKLGLRSDGNLAWRNQSIIHSGNIGSQSVNYANSAGTSSNSDKLDNIDSTGFLAWTGMSASGGSSAPFQTSVDFFNNTANLNAGARMIYNYPGNEYTILYTRRSDATGHGSILRWGYPDNYIRMIRMISGSPQTSDWEKISAGYADSAGYASSAGSVAWDNITGKPPSFTPSSHTHDDRYYTESESDSRYVNVTGDTMTGDLHVYAHTYCGYGTGSSVIDYNVYAMYVGTNGTRTGTAGSYIGGIAFTHMIKYSGGYGYCNSPQGWIGLRTVDYPGSERSSLVFATKPGTGTSNTGDDIPIERMCITPAGNVGIATTNPSSYKLEVNGDTYSTGYVRAASGFVKGSSSNDYVLLGGGGHKAISDFSMAHSHPYLPTAGGTMTGAINLSNTNAKLAFGSLATSPITGYKAPSLQSNGVGIYSRYGEGGDEGAIIITEDTCVIYNSADTGWNFQVMDKDIGTDMTNDATRSFGVNQNHQAWSLAGFVKSGSSDSYVLLGGGGHKAESSLSVNYANSAGSAGSADNATNATNASNLKHNSSGALSSISFYVASGVSETLVSAPSYCKPAGVDSDGNTMILRMRWSSGAYGHDIYAGPNAPELWHRNTKNNTEAWRKIIDSGNIGSQSVSYATSAGTASYVTIHYSSDYNSTCQMLWGYNGNNVCGTAGIYCNPNTDSLYASAFYETSDERLKDFENSVNVDLNLIRSIPKMYFRWKKNPNKLQIGTSAQAVKQIYPELVSSSEDDILSVDYSKLSIVALSAIDKLHLENQELKHEINLLKQEIEKLKGQI